MIRICRTLRPSDHEAGPFAWVARVEEVSHRLAVRDRPQPGVVTVDGLGPGRDGPARGHLEHVGREPAVGEAEVERGGVGVAAVVEVGDFGDAGVCGDRVVHGALDQRLVTHGGVVRPRSRDDLVVDRVHALGALLDADEHPAAVPPAERPELAESDGLGQAAGALDVVAGAVLDVVAEPGIDPDRHGVGGFVSAVVEADVLDVRLADDLDPVAPAAAIHVVETPVPFLQEVGADELAEPRAVAAVPGGLDLLEQRGGVGPDRVGGERGVVLGGLGGGC